MTDAAHRQLLKAVRALRGKVMISGYRSGLYERYLEGWRRVDFAVVAHGGMPRTECVWLSPNCEEAQRRLF